MLKKFFNQKELLNYLYKNDFLIVYNRKFEILKKKGIFKVLNIKKKIDTNALLPLIQVFKYKTDNNDYIIKFKLRLIARGDF